MANRVNVNVNVSDRSEAGLASLRRSMRQARRTAQRAGTDIRFRVVIPDDATRREVRRIRRSLRGEDIDFTTTVSPPTPGSVSRLRRALRRLHRPVTIPVRASGRGLRASFMGPLRSLGGLASGTLQDGVGQGIVMGFKSGGPVGMAFLGALILGLASVIGAALSGLLVTALGAAFVGVAGVSAAMSKEIKAQWSETLGVLKEEFAEVGKPLIPVLDRGLERLEEMAKRAGPKLQEAVERTAPATEAFLNRLLDGFESFGAAAFDKIMDAWNVFAPVFGDQWNEFMRELGEQFGEMADLVKEHPTEIAAALEVIFEALELLVRGVVFFGKMWTFVMQNVGDVIGFLIQGVIIPFTATVLGAFDAIVSGATTLFGWVPGVGDKLEQANTAFDNFKEDVLTGLESAADAAYGWDDALNQANRKRTLQADIESWKHKLSIARADLKKTTSQKARAKLEANIKDLQDKVRRAREELNALNGKTSTTYVQTVYLSGGRAAGGDGTRGGRLEHGGVVGAAATGGVRSNMTLVGEAGPELVRLPTGSNVRSNPDTRRILAQQGGAGGVGVLEIVSDDAFLIEWLRKAVRNRGGNFDIVFQKGRRG